MASEKLRKIAQVVKEITVSASQARYDISGLTLGICKFFYRTPQNLFQDLSSGDYTIDTSSNSQVLVIQNAELLKTMEAIQVCYIVDLTSSRYETDFNVDTNQLKDNYNKLVDDVHVLWNYIKKVGIVADDTSIPLILPQLNTDEVWVKTDDGYKGISLTDAEGTIKKVIEAYTEEMKKVLDAYVEDPLKPRLDQYVEDVNKPELDNHVTTINKPELDRYTTELEKRLQVMIDQAVADKGLMPPDKDWFNLEFGNYLVTDIFTKNYTNLPPTLNTIDKDGVVKVNIVDGGRTQVIRYYTATGKMFFVVKTNNVWSEWQEMGEQTDAMQFTQAGHGFIFTAVTLDGATRQWVKANKNTGADGIAIRIDDDRFDVVIRGIAEVPSTARDDKGDTFVYDEYYFLSQTVDGGLARDKNEVGTFQVLAHISELDEKQVAYVDIGDAYNLDYTVLDKEGAKRIGIATSDDLDALKKDFEAYCPYRVGDIYQTTNDTNPSTIWLGTTWEKIEDCVLRATKSGQASKQTGGSDEVIIARENLPNEKLNVDEHSHTQVEHAHSLAGGSRHTSIAGGGGADAYNTTGIRYTSNAGGETTGTASPQTEAMGSGIPLNIMPKYYTAHTWLRTS